MNEAAAATLPGPYVLITILHVVTLTLHFVTMNFLVGGIVAVLFGGFDNRWNHPTVRKFVKLFPSVMAATISLGVAPLLFLQLVYHDQAYSAAVVGGWFWMGIVVAAIAGYYLLYAASFRSAGGKAVGRFLAVALVCLLYISFVYSNVFSLAENTELIREIYRGDQRGFGLNSDVGSWIFRWIHMLLGAVTVGGFFVGLLGRDNARATQVGKRFFLFGMLGAMALGTAYLVTLGDILASLMRAAAIWWLTASIVLSVASLVLFTRRRWTLSAAALFVSLLGMVVLRHEVRLLHLAGSFDPRTLDTRAEWGPIGVFLACFALAATTLVYMSRMFVAGGRDTGGRARR